MHFGLVVKELDVFIKAHSLIHDTPLTLRVRAVHGSIWARFVPNPEPTGRNWVAKH